MKQIRKRLRLLLMVMASMFALLVAYAVYSLNMYDTRWFTSGSNTFVRTVKKNVVPGDIFDRNHVLLATSSDGERVYQDDLAARSAVVHVLGDNLSHVSYGVETFMAKYLYGFDASYIERLSAALRGETRRGDDVFLTIDSRLSTLIARAFPTGKAGAVAVMNYQTGEVLSIQSFPTFDPQSITSAVKNDPQKPFFNRAIQGLYAPGSTFKIVTAACALQNLPDAQTLTLLCDGQLQVDGHVITDAGTTKEDLEAGSVSGHGELTLQSAFIKSCNNSFARLALALGDAQLKKTAEGFGFGDNFLFRDIVLQNSAYPGGARSAFELAWTGAGQSALLSSPLHMLLVASAVANDGVMMEPRILQSAQSAGGTVRAGFAQKEYKRALSTETADILKTYMRGVVTSGTGTAAGVSGVRVCGKTGSAQLDTQEDTNAWFVGFIDDESAPYAACVVVENAGGGGAVAAPIAKTIFTYLANQGK